MADKDPTPAVKAPLVPKSVQVGGESLLDRLLPHVKKIAFGIGVVAVILSVVFAFRWYKQRGEAADTMKVAQVLEVSQRPLRGSDDKPDPKNPSFATGKERSAQVLDAMAKQDTNGVSPAYRAGLLYDTGKLDEALAEYKRCATVVGVEGVVCREGVGLVTEAKAAAEKDSKVQHTGYEAALAAFKAEQPDDTGPRAGYAHYHQGRMLFLLNRKDEAKKEFEKARDLGKDVFDLPELVRKRLAGLGA
jgi:tetratricopeptide (TPR) repeat protein